MDRRDDNALDGLMEGGSITSKSANEQLGAARMAQEDEFYTQLSDIEQELRHYKAHFKGKVVYCNCDDPRVSEFFHYFSYNFEKLGLKRLITTCYRSQQRDLFSQNDSDQAISLEYRGDKDGNNVPDPKEIGIEPLEGDGDFRSEEAIELLRQADIVVTNPPFSLFREYVAQLVKYDKKFLIIGNKNAISLKEIFPLIRDNKMWLGNTPMGHDMLFRVPEATAESLVANHKEGSKWRRVDGVVYARSSAVWFTNMEYPQRHEDLILYRTYTPDEYPVYDNYDAINVDQVAAIPMDYDGVMGVPITFLDKHNPDQFEILGLSGTSDYPVTKKYGKKERVVNGERKKSNTGTLGCVVRTDSFGAGTHFDVGYPVRGIYKRLFIRRRETS